MNTKQPSHPWIIRLSSVIFIAALLLSACAPAAKKPPVNTPVVSIKLGGLATGFTTETVPAVEAGVNTPWWQVLPDYTLITLVDYSLSGSQYEPQIFIYRVDDLAQINEQAAKVIATLKTLLQSPQEIADMPALPLVNAVKVMHTHLQYLDFKNGQGLRFLTQFSQGIVPVNNAELVYTYQGLTADGKYYVAAVLPVSHPSLPATGAITGNEPADFSSNYTAYTAAVAQVLNVLADSTFSPDLTRLDALFASLEVK